jgi:hypothetical protein
VDLKNRFGDVETDGHNRLHVWLLRIVGALAAPHPWHSRAGVAEPSTALRRTLRDGRDGNRFIINIPGRGYRFVASIKVPGDEN